MRKHFEWKGYSPENQQVLFNLYGANHPEIWHNPNKFQPERFMRWDEDSFNFIPPGVGDYYQNHRCPGKEVTIELMKKGT